MYRNKWLILLVIAAMVLAAALTGCAKENPPTSGGDTGGDATDKPPGEPPKVEDLPMVDIIWYQIGEAPNGSDVMLEKLNEYLAEKIKVKLDLRWTEAGANYNEKMNVIINSGEYYDICFTSNWAAYYFELAPKGAFVALNDMLPQYGPELLKVITEDIWEGSRINGKNYAVPVLKDMAELAVLNVNVKYAEKYGIDYKKLGDDINLVTEALEKVSAEIQEDPNFIPIINYPVGGAHGQTALPYQQIIWPFGVAWDCKDPNFKPDYKVVNILETPELAELLNIIRGWNEAGYYNRDLMAPDTGRDFYTDGNWFLDWYGYFPYHEYSQSLSLGYKVDVVPTTPQKKTTASLTGAMHAIGVVSDHPERALMFLNLLNSDPVVRNFVGYGVEGVHYDLVDGKVSFGDRSPEERYSPWQAMLGNNTLLYLLENEPEDKWEFFHNYNNNAAISPILGFFPDRTNIDTELTVMNSIINEYERYLWNGAIDPKVKLPEYIQKIKEAGGDKVINELQTQLDAWLQTR
ncbi:MAG TPA: ABC transporter substrate-binding protein [Clostridiales bacterium]|nr:ABC transporter substrate-binding protein [Clostridiales bacterium]